MGERELLVEITRLTGLLHGQEVMRQQLIRQHEEMRVERGLWKKRHDSLHSWQGLMSLLDEHYPADIFDGSSGNEGPRIVALTREIDRLRREVEFEACGDNWPMIEYAIFSPPVCACVTDEQDASLGPGFSRPVCAVHPTLSDIQVTPNFGADPEYKGGGA